MTAIVTKVPKFRKNQTVRFVGGTGKIRNCMLGSGSWNYLVEMEMGPKPEIGRVGHETKIWLFETDLASEDNVTYGLAIA